MCFLFGNRGSQGFLKNFFGGVVVSVLKKALESKRAKRALLAVKRNLPTAFAVAVGLVSASFAEGNATEAITVPTTIKMDAVYTLVGTILSAGVGLFAVRKVIKLMNRS